MSAELVALGVAGILLGLAAGFAISREVTVERVRQIVGGGSGEPLESAVRDLLERSSQAEWRARLESQDLAHLTELVGTGIIRLDDDLRVTAANRAAHLYLDVAPGALLGRRVADRPGVRPDDVSEEAALGLGDVRLDAVTRTAWRNGSAADEIAVGGPEGRTLSIRARRSPSEGVWVVLEDLSELRRLQRIRTEFIDNLSHELRTPLTTVRLLTETLARDLEEIEVPERVVEIVQKIDVETGHLVQMATELLDLAKIEQAGKPQLYIDDVDLAPIVTSVLDRLALFAERQGVRLRAEIDPATPPVLGDAERLGQLLINLVHNAIKFSPSGGDVIVRARPQPAPAASASTRSAFVVLEVEDHGVGIPEADLPRVFERFYKVDKARVRGGGGTGLGLAIVRHIAEDHGGQVAVESVEGMGSTFRVTLPGAPPVPTVGRRTGN